MAIHSNILDWKISRREESGGLQSTWSQRVGHDQSWVFVGRTDVEAETPILWPPDAKNWLTGKDPDAGKDRGQEEKGTTEDETVGWHHWLYGHGFGWTLGVGDGQGGLTCCGSWGRKESDMTKPLNWSKMNKLWYIYKLKCYTLIQMNELYASMEIYYEFYSALLELVALSCPWNFLSTVASALRKQILLTVNRKFLTLYLYNLKNVHCFHSVTMAIMPHKD